MNIKLETGNWVTYAEYGPNDDVWIYCEDGRFVNLFTGTYEIPDGELRLADRDDLT